MEDIRLLFKVDRGRWAGADEARRRRLQDDVRT